MKTIRRTLLWLWCLAYMAHGQTNGDFTSDLAGWTVTGSVSAESYLSGPLASFNGTATSDFPNDGVLSQSVPTIPGRAYSVTFDLGVTGSATGGFQTLQLNGSDFGMAKDQPGTQWVKRTFTFTATAATTTLTFRDVSTVTDGIDLLLDNVVVTIVPESTPVITPIISPCKLAWDAQAGASFRVYVNGAYRVTVPINEATLDLSTEALSTLTVDAIDPSGASSIPSLPLVVQPVTLETSSDLKTWERGNIFFAEATPKFFVRAKFIKHTPTPTQ